MAADGENSRSILIAEDDDGILELLLDCLGREGWHVVQVRTAAETLAYLASNVPFLMILDYGLPDLTGQELVERLRATNLPIPPFIISTGQGDERIAVSMMKLGARDYIIKDTYFLARIPEVVRRLAVELENEEKLRATENSLRTTSAFLSALFEQAPMAIHVVDERGNTVSMNRAYESLWSQSAPEVLNVKNVLLADNQMSSVFADFIRPAFSGEFCYNEDFVFDPSVFGRKGSDQKHLNVFAFPIKEDYEVRSVVIILNDITRQKRAEEKVHQLVFYDPLTGLPNRILMLDRLSQRITYLQRHERQDVLMLLNIDRFKVINEARGNLQGDALLCAVGARIQSMMRDSDTVARMNADEFAILMLHEEENPEQLSLFTLSISERIRESLKNPFIINGESFSITASFGITLLPMDSDDTSGSALRRADTALHRAKEAGGNQCAFFETVMGESASENYLLEKDLMQAIVNRELRLYLQPQVDAHGVFVGAECLLRWQHPSRGLLAPGLFVPIAEQSDLIVELGSWVMTQACKFLVEGTATGKGIRLSVNVSPRHFRKGNFVPWLKGLLQRSGADPSRITLEITESLFIDNISDVVAKMNDLVAMGIRFSIDDFGTGYSSLAYLKRLPIHELKIDKAFVQDAPTDSNDAVLVETILAVAAHMRLKIVAEGVETETQAEFLNARAEVVHQGYLYGRPEPAEKCIERWK
jgi:diguanylate cyclase (GGDEF)-like protein/PAS domain S-box-containing protein